MVKVMVLLGKMGLGDENSKLSELQHCKNNNEPNKSIAQL
jgi:hypothetical protein